ncbi:MAG: Molybdopterin-synthase adenylyltransferase, partial [Pseudomonadota bacterium]
LQRQIAHNLERVGSPKAESARTAMHAINPEVRIDALVRRADDALLDELLPTAQLVLDCTDNFATRHLINRACVRHRVPLVSGAAIRFDGQLSVYDPRDPRSPCYACVFPETDGLEETRCATMGVFAPLVGIIGTLQAAEALKILCGMGSRLVGKLMMLDGRGMDFHTIGLGRNPECPVCGGRH